MERWRLIDLGKVEPYMAQCFYEAVASAVDKGLSTNTVLLCQPASPYVCIGYHQELDREIDVEYCRNRGLPVIRRSQGGGATYLNSDQIFYQVVGRSESALIPSNVEDLFQKFLSVTVHVYRRLGVPAEFKSVNDVVVDGRKISGNGAGRFGDHTTILVGNIILDLDYDSMAQVLRVPSEKFRDKMAGSMRSWVTSLRRELGYVPSVTEVKRLLVEGYERILGIKLTQSMPTNEENRIWKEETMPKHVSREWLTHQRESHAGFLSVRSIKITGGVNVAEADHKARKLIRVRAEMMNNKILNIVISGDFFMIPEESIGDLELRLRGVDLTRGQLLGAIGAFYRESRVETPGIVMEDFVDAIMKLKSVAQESPS